jgi:hypothetical protein
MARDSRVAVVVRPLDRTLAVSRVALVPTVALALSLPSTVALADAARNGATGWVLGVIGPLVALVYLFLLRTESVGTRIDHLLARLRRRIALACNHDYATEHDDATLACLLTPEVFQSPIFRYDEQHALVSKLLVACSAKHEPSYWFVEGKSGSGKTRAALLLVQALARDRDLCELGNRCYLYDFSDSSATQEALLRGLATARHDGGVVIVDNFQLVRPSVLGALTDRLVDRRAKLPQRLVVFLARPRDTWNMSPGSDVRLLSSAKGADRHQELMGPHTDSVVRGVAEVDSHAPELLSRLHAEYLASAAQLHLAQVIARNREMPADVLAILELLDGTSAVIPTPLTAHLLGILSALAVHRGGFSTRELLAAIRLAPSTKGSPSRLLATIRTYLSFRRLHRIGLVPKLHLEGTRFIFHEGIAELCIDRLSDRTSFLTPFREVGKCRLERLDAASDTLGAWLVATEIADQTATKSMFDAALATGANARMVQCLQRARERYELSGATRLQLAILLDRVGEFAASRAEFADQRVAELTDSEDLAVMLAATRLEANHYFGYDEDLAFLSEHSDRFASIVASYWRAHIDMHHGRFNAQYLEELATEAFGIVQEHHTYWQVYMLARIHFDAMRAHYLAGDYQTTEPHRDSVRDVGKYLKGRVPTYDALELLYARAHRVGHVALSRFALFAESPEPDELAIAGLDPARAASLGDLTLAAAELYRLSRDEFWRYGDREASYLQADILNAEMIQSGSDLDGLLVALHKYQRFIGQGGRTVLASYPHLYFFRWHVLKYYDLLLTARTVDERAIDEQYAGAERSVERILELDAASGNQYGLLRGRILRMLLGAIRQRPRDAVLTQLLDASREGGYQFETRLLEHLRAPNDLAPVDVQTILRFYPFVHQ